METIERGKQKKTNLYDVEGDREKQTKKHRETIEGKQTKGNKHRKGKKQTPPALSQRRRT